MLVPSFGCSDAICPCKADGLPKTASVLLRFYCSHVPCKLSRKHALKLLLWLFMSYHIKYWFWQLFNWSNSSCFAAYEAAWCLWLCLVMFCATEYRSSNVHVRENLWLLHCCCSLLYPLYYIVLVKSLKLVLLSWMRSRFRF